RLLEAEVRHALEPPQGVGTAGAEARDKGSKGAQNLASSTAERALQALTCALLGVWRSLVARSVRVGEVPSSNLGTPMPPRAAFGTARSTGAPPGPPGAPSSQAGAAT